MEPFSFGGLASAEINKRKSFRGEDMAFESPKGKGLSCLISGRLNPSRERF